MSHASEGAKTAAQVTLIGGIDGCGQIREDQAAPCSISMRRARLTAWSPIRS